MIGKIVKIAWRSGIDSVCIVAVEYGHYWQAYIGANRIKHYESVSILINEPEPHQVTEQRTAEHGCKLSWQEAQAFFPELDIKRYKTHPECEAFRAIPKIVSALETGENLSTQASV